MFVAYEVLLYLVFIVMLPFFLFTGLLRGKYLTNFPERLGIYRTPRRAHDLWIHAVSVGETIAAKPVVADIQRMRPGTSIVMTTTTITGQAQARRLYPGATIAYFPFDFSFAVKRFLNHHAPRVFATMETEIWPNVTRIARARGLKLILANGRISDRSFPRYRTFRAIVGPIVRTYDRILAREETDRERFEAIGATTVEVSGNVKFDYQPDATPLDLRFGSRRVLILGSTMEGEDEQLVPLLDDFLRKHDAAVLIAPRKAERFDAVARLLEQAGLNYARRSAAEGGGAPPRVLLLDTFGELARAYRYGTAAFVGGTIAPIGGHNPIEPAAAGVPVCFGPSMTNFREIASAFLEAGAAEEVRTAAEVIAFASRMFENEAEQRERGARAREVVERNRGASERTARRIVELLA
ncbi:MAG TPA: 3-deoxy-D-manno-octulosonic acid transferase [Thermoanaerobaculia bacterium]|nr:3-deoxy-D-manno-octulosonic acid transferase [Thermoanaerobaculia bacterium]